MGLSGNERRNGIYFCVDRLTKLARDLDTTDHVAHFSEGAIPRLKEICESAHLWHAFIGDQSNSAHWLFGSEAGNVVTSESNGPWGTAVMTTMREWRESMSDSVLRLERSGKFNAFDHFLSISGLLGQWSKTAGTIFDIYTTAENMNYYLRRYKDGMLAQHHALNVTLSEIGGLCFGVFTENRQFTLAYLVHEIAKIVYGDTSYNEFPENQDWVTQWADKNCIHHYMSRPLADRLNDKLFTVVAKTHAHLTTRWINTGRTHKNIPFERVVAAVILSGRRFEYDHQHRALRKLCVENGFTAEQITELNGYLRRCVRDHERRSTDDREHFRRDYDRRELSIHQE
jgi:hypothetical protein